VTESVALLPDLGEQHMPQSLADRRSTEIERPPCPKCHGPMMLTGVVSGPDGPDVRSFECSLCNCSEKVTVEMK
jgi:formate dehydrogenase maturation protein FdhE